MKTRPVLLGEIADTCLGKMLDQKKNKGTYQPYLANVSVRWGGFDLDDLPQMRFEEDEEERYGLRYGDILVCEGGEPGRCAIWKDQIPNMKFQKALHRVRVHEDVVDFQWLFYRFLLARSRREFDQYFSGTTTIKHMPGDKLIKIRLDLPDLIVQKKIGEVLSAYDDLIETNQRQIKLLEEAARRLYREWFVDLRFPGHEDVPVVDGVPEGWKKCILGNLFDVIRGKSYSSAEISGNDGLPMVNLSNIRPFGGYNRQQEKTFSGRAVGNRLQRFHILPGFRGHGSYSEPSLHYHASIIAVLLNTNMLSNLTAERNVVENESLFLKLLGNFVIDRSFSFGISDGKDNTELLLEFFSGFSSFSLNRFTEKSFDSQYPGENLVSFLISIPYAAH